MREKIKHPMRERAGGRVLLRAPVLSRYGVSGKLAELEEALSDPGPGEPLAPSIRRKMEAGFGMNFGAVRIHADERAGRAADAISARAFTAGTDIYFARSAYAPEQEAGRRLLTHELAHVSQGARGAMPASGEWRVSEPSDPVEREAEAAVARFDADPPRSREEGAAELVPLASAPPAAAGVLLRAPADASELDTLIEKVGTDIDAATAPPNTKRRKLEKATAKAKEKARKSAVLALADQVRSEVPDRAKLDALLDDTSLSDEAKVATLGEIAVQVARMEFLLGWMYHGGVPGKTGGKKTWEDAGTNKGAFPNLYQAEVGYWKDTGGSQWCTSFAGYAFKRIGLDSSLFESSGYVFGSGKRLEKWATLGQNRKGAQLTPEDQTVASLDSAAFTGSDTWKTLTTALKDSDAAVAKQVKQEKLRKTDPEAARRKAEGRAAAVAEFMAEYGEPQPGDIVVLGKENAYKGGSSSHTVMVERYDSETATITTVEGNAIHAVRSQKLVLTNPTDAARIIHLTRPGIEHYQRGTSATAPATASGDTREALKSSVQAVIEKLVKLASDREWILSDDADASVYEWLYGPEAGDDAGAGMSTE